MNGADRDYRFPDITPETINGKHAWVCYRKCPACREYVHTNGTDFECLVCGWNEIQNSSRNWTTHEEGLFIFMYINGASMQEISREIDRSIPACYKKRSIMKASGVID